ncbi:MAG TPA: type II secretion system F family protein, partial [Burkholderiaceae bacterium]|nr:type II secretion system F family protein [Burkholderiaceae bacterium]
MSSAAELELPPVVLLCAAAAVALAAIGLKQLLSVIGTRYRDRVTQDFRSRLQQAFVFVDATRLLHANLALLGLLPAGAFLVTGSALAALLGLLVAAAAPAALLTWLRRRRLKRFVRQWPDAVMLIAGGLRAGSSLPQAIAQAASEISPPCGQELDMIAREQRLGLSLEESAINLERRVRAEEVALFCAAVRIAHEAGGDLAEVLERLSGSLRRKLAIEDKIQSLTAQGRLQGWIMALLPAAVAVALFAIEPVAMQPLVSTWQGWSVCALVLGLQG